MTDEQLDPHDAEVRRLLADARHTEPMPPDVVARLDGVLADLAAEPARVRPVTDLATRRRRVTGLLVAAAAVVVVGVGIQQVVQPGASDDAAKDAPSASRLAEESDGAADAGGSGAGAESGQNDTATNGEAPGTFGSVPEATKEGGLPRLRVQRFAADVRVVRSELAGYDTGAPTGGGSPELDAVQLYALQAAGVACRADTWGEGSFVAVRYGRTPAVLVFRRALGDTQVADLFLCGTTEPARSLTLPAP